MADGESRGFDAVFWEVYDRGLKEGPDLEVPDLRRPAYQAAIEHCIKAGMADDLASKLGTYASDDFDAFIKAFKFLVRQGKSRRPRTDLQQQVRHMLQQYYKSLRSAARLQSSPTPLDRKVGHTPDSYLLLSVKQREELLRHIEVYMKILKLEGKDREIRKVGAILAQVKSGQLPPKPNIPPESRPMDEATFWSLIEEIGGQKGDVPDKCDWLATRLGAFKPKEIVKFSKVLSQLKTQAYRWDLLGACAVVMGMSSDDSFEYFRAWLILQGKDKFANALNDPDTIADWIKRNQECEAEELLYVAETAYAEIKGDDLPDSAFVKDPKKLAGKQWKEEDLPKLYPKLCKKFGFGREK